MAWTQTDLDKLDSAIADGRGARQISFGDQSVTFHDIDQMLKLRAEMRREIAVAANPTRHYRLAATRKGV